MKTHIYRIALLLVGLAFTFTSCKKLPLQPNVGYQPIDPGNDEIETVEPRIPMRVANEPNFWDPTYRSNRIVRLQVDVANDLFLKWGNNTEANVRRMYRVDSLILESLTGIRLQTSIRLIWTTPDPYASLTTAGQVLNAWAGSFTTNPDVFYQFINNKNMGGVAFINRGNVTSFRFGFASLANWSPAPDPSVYSFANFNVLHELSHNLGLSHTHNDCAWLDQAGNRLGRLDFCYNCESTCTPRLATCTGSTQSMDGGINSYCYLYGRARYAYHPASLAVLHRALFYSKLPTYTPTVTPPPAPVITRRVSVKGTPFTGYTLRDTIRAINDTLTDRWLSQGPTVVTYTYSQPTTLTAEFGMRSGFNGGSFNQTFVLKVDGVVVNLNYTPTETFRRTATVTGRVFEITTTGVSGISRVFEIWMK